MKYEFKKGNTGIEDFEYVYFPISKEYATFTQEEDCLRNDKGVGFKGEDYIDAISTQTTTSLFSTALRLLSVIMFL